MIQAPTLPVLLAPILLVAACSTTRTFTPEPILPEPVFNKFGEIAQCVAPDGRTYSPVEGADNPCNPSDCIEGSVSVDGVFVCPDDTDEPDPRGGDDPDDPPQRDPGDPATPPPTRPSGLAAVPPTSN